MRKFAWGGALVIVGLTSAPAWADTSGDVKALFNAGRAHFQRREYEEARQSFAGAYAIDPSTGTLLNLAISELQTSRFLDAAGHFRAYLERPDSPEDKRTSVQSDLLPRAEAQLAHVRVIVPSGAQVLVDGQPAQQDPSLGTIEVAAGDHDLVVQASGRSETQHVSVQAGATLMMRALVDDAAPAPPNVVLDEPPPAPASTSGAKVATVVSLGVGALAGLGVGIGFGLAASAKASDIRTGEGCLASAPTSVPCQRENYDVSVEHREEWASIGGYVGAGVLGAAGVATWFLWPRSPVHVSATAEPHEVGFGVTGRW